ncbi:MAG: hypothetical protein CMB80_02560 [Flammeovirgaceae bacterium]|nr:hypothetical protein [Flammeovirgaceae bacterium]
MAVPTSRDELIDYSLRKLGSPVVEINVDRQQCEDRLDEALEMFSERHFDGSEKAYFKYQITQTDKDNMYISTDAFGPVNGATGDGPTGKDILSVVRLFQFGNFSNINMFDVRYQLALTDYFGINRGLGFNSTMGLARYDSTKRYINMIQDFFQPEKRIRFNKVSNKIHLDMNDADLSVGKYLIIEAYVKIPSVAFSQIFDDVWLKKYTTALIKRQWGQNMSKFEGVQLPGGVSLRGGEVYNEANEEIQRLEEELKTIYELPIDFNVG